MTQKLIGLDLDGTLTDSKKRVSQRNRAAQDRARERGHVVVLASGRPLPGVMPVAQELEFAEKGGFLLASNGSQIVDGRSGEVLAEQTLPPKYYHRILQLTKEFGCEAMTYDERSILTETPDAKYVRAEAFNNSLPVTKVDSLEAALPGPVPKFLLVEEHEKLVPLEAALQKEFGETLSIFFALPYFLDVNPRGVDKAAGLAKLCAHLRIPRDQAVAFGDGTNDITMLTWAGTGVAMGNACEETKACADLVAPTNDEDGVAQTLEALDIV